VANDAIEQLFPGQSGRPPGAGAKAPAPGAGPQPPANIPRINTPEEAAALPPGSQYVAPDNSIRQTGPRPPRAAAGGAQPQQPAPAALAPGAGGAPAGQRAATAPAAAAPAGPAEPPQAAAFDQAREEVKAARLQLKSAREAMLRYGSRQRQADPEGFEAAKRAVAAAEAEVLAAQGRSAEAQAAYEQAMTAGPYMADAGARRLQ
jgi:hypothetical protein